MRQQAYKDLAEAKRQAKERLAKAREAGKRLYRAKAKLAKAEYDSEYQVTKKFRALLVKHKAAHARVNYGKD